ncbi:hypothetical protein FDECE_13449 [Fusarium decemcellulare]|nr:hypothetical protein FDECE_13449 [Fusarium decemcellulare]
MEINDLPGEILDLIIDKVAEKQSYYGWAHIHDMCQARLVCRKWNDLVAKRLFKTITLHHSGSTADSNFESWNKLLNQTAIRDTVQRVVIETCPAKLRSERDYDTWERWETDGEYPAFTSAVERISELDKLQSVEVRFSEWCRGWENRGRWDDDREMPETRENSLKSVLKGLQQREARQLEDGGGGITTVRELKLENLQNDSLPSELTDALFKGIERLHILICEECNQHGPDHDLGLSERVTYEPDLQYSLLPSVADQLVELTLSAQYSWGVMPGVFDGVGLDFPRLKTLTLSDYAIGHHKQFDWVTNQKTLTCLRLNNCHIVSHIRVYQDQLDEWGIEVDDWEKADGTFYFGEDQDEIYLFSKRWDAIFDSIREGLPKLTEFSLSWENSSEEFFRHPDATGVNDRWEERYFTFEAGLLPSPFVDSGEFGYWSDDDDEDPDPKRPYNLAQFTDEQDRRAFDALIQATRERRRKP